MKVSLTLSLILIPTYRKYLARSKLWRIAVHRRIARCAYMYRAPAEYWRPRGKLNECSSRGGHLFPTRFERPRLM